MTPLTLDRAGLIRLGFFAGVFLFVALWEAYRPRRARSVPKARRWTVNLGMTFLNTVIVRMVFAGGALGTAVLAHARGWGLLNNVRLPFAVTVAVSIVGMDFAIYLQHVMFHAVPTFWRLHMVHHTDLDYDLTTGTRFHPIEMLLSMLIKMAVVLLLGASALGVLAFEIILNATSMFNHGNLHIPNHIDRTLRWLLVTPDMHRVHHSVIPRETNSNFGFSLPWWDRVCGTYRAQPEAGHDGMTIGLKEYRDSNRLGLPRLLVMPFLKRRQKAGKGPGAMPVESANLH